MKICIRVLLLFLIVSVFFVNTKPLQANAGPPANVEVVIINSDVDYYFDLLVPLESMLNQQDIDDALLRIDRIREEEYHSFYYTNDYPTALATFQDDDQFVANTLYGEVDYFYRMSYLESDQDQIFRMWLGVPKIFKIVLYTEHGSIITSERIEMDQFDYRLTYDLEGIDLTVDQFEVGTISGFVGNPLTNPATILNFFVRVLLTVAVEVSLLFLFGFRKKHTYIFVALMNVITQSALTFGTLAAFYGSRSYGVSALIITFIIGELFVYTSEFILVGVFVKEKALWYRLLYVLVANTVTIVLGFYLIEWLLFLL